MVPWKAVPATTGNRGADTASYPGLIILIRAVGKLDAWIDCNSDGDWDDASDRIFADENLVPGVNTLSFTLPPNAVAGTTATRFRFSTEGGLMPIGPAMDGEVEDYRVEIIDFIDGFESGNTSAWP